MNNKNKCAFTLLELLVVIVILLILFTISFISLQGYNKKARDVTRLSDITLLRKSLSLYETNKGLYPLPESYTGITYSGSIAWYQGIMGSQVTTNLSNLSKTPLDPKYGVEYSYSVTQNLKEYELSFVFESEQLANNTNIISNTYADNINAKIVGNYNQKFIKTTIDNIIYYLSVPSIILSDINGVSKTELKTMGNNNFVYNNKNNLPASYSKTPLTLTGSFYFPTGEVIYSGEKIPETDNEVLSFMENLRDDFSTTELSFELDINTIINSDSGTLIKIGRYLLENNPKYLVGISFGGGGSDSGDNSGGTETVLDSIPNQFTFIDKIGVKINTETISDSVIISGINTGSLVSISGGSYNINDGIYQTGTGLIYNGDELRVKLISGSNYEEIKSVVLDINGVNDSFDVTTMTADTILVEFPDGEEETITCSGCD